MSGDRTGIQLFRISGIRIRLDYSWFLIFLLILVTLSVGYFPGVSPDSGVAGHWLAGAVATLLFFASILLHELAHSWVARREGIDVPEITLFLFGGASQMAEEPERPQVELRVAIAGPLVSLALAFAFGALAGALAGTPWMIGTVLAYLAWINLALAAFNLLPAYPMDGGRVLRALVWWKTGSLRRATRVASRVGQAFAVALMILGGVQILFGALIGGVWMILIAAFLRSLAKRSYETLVLQRSLADVEVEQVMVPRDALVTVGPELPLRGLVDDYVLEHGYRSFPVVEEGRPVGLVSIRDVRRIAKERWPDASVRDVMRAADEETSIEPDSSLLTALQRLAPGGPGLLVRRDGELVGLLTPGRAARVAELRNLALES